MSDLFSQLLTGRADSADAYGSQGLSMIASRRSEVTRSRSAPFIQKSPFPKPLEALGTVFPTLPLRVLLHHVAQAQSLLMVRPFRYDSDDGQHARKEAKDHSPRDNGDDRQNPLQHPRRSILEASGNIGQQVGGDPA
jgi:hypothetical protein